MKASAPARLTRENFLGPWAGLPVSWTNDGRLDEATYRGDVARCCEAGMPGVYTGGTSGEFYAQEIDDFEVVARATVEECARRGVPAMIGCTSLSTRGAIRRVKFAREIGAQAVQLALPFWMPVAEHEIVPFFKAVGDEAGDMAVSVYETGRAKVKLTIDQHRAVKDAVPRYIMVKSNEGTLGHDAKGCAELSKFTNVFVGEDAWAELGPHGAVGCCSSVVYWNPKFMLDQWAALKARDWARLQGGCDRVSAMFKFLFDSFGKRGFTDTAFDSLGGKVTGFLKTSFYRPGPYSHGDDKDLQLWRNWCKTNWPEFLNI